ncbi:hypothetical protein [Microcoleus sp. FACHB-672]|nr:hypothetical protein [Microcoleus sp. FACHB-672]MBD2041601.1 hypothetical protein [Microcoleus sp. FACHB-672]
MPAQTTELSQLSENSISNPIETPALCASVIVKTKHTRLYQQTIDK